MSAYNYGAGIAGGGTLTSGEDLSTKTGYICKTLTAPVIATDNAGFGVILDGGVESGSQITVGLFGGPFPALAGGVIAVNDDVYPDSTGRLIKSTTGKYPIGKACTAAAAAGDWFDVWMTGIADEATA